MKIRLGMVLVLVLAATASPSSAQAISLVGKWSVRDAGETADRALPQPWSRRFAILRDDAELVVMTDTDLILSFTLDGKPVKTRVEKFGFVTETTTTTSRSKGGIVIATQTGDNRSLTTLMLADGKLTITRELGGRGGQALPATYTRSVAK